MAGWIARVVARRAPNAVRCADPFHVVMWATDALDVERRRAWNEASGRRRTDQVTGRRPIAIGNAKAINRPIRPMENPDRLTDTKQQLADRQNRPRPAPRLPAQRSPALRVHRQRRRRQRSPRPLDQLGPPITAPRLHRSAAPHRQTPRSHPRRPRYQTLQRPDRVDQHQNPAPHPHRLRIRTPSPSPSPGSTSAPTNPTYPAELTHRSARRAHRSKERDQGCTAGDAQPQGDGAAPRPVPASSCERRG